MGRPKSFNKDQVVFRAMEIFWRKGYEATSMQDLIEGMEISRSSFYETFQSKEILFIETLKLFSRMTDEGFQLTLFSKDDASLPEIILHFALSRRMQLMDEDKGSCYFANSTLEMASMLKEVELESNKFFSKYKDAFKFAIENGKRKGEISSKLDSDTISWHLVNGISGLSVLKKSGIPQEQIDNVIISTLSIFSSFSPQSFYQKVDEVEKFYQAKMQEQLDQISNQGIVSTSTN